MSSKAERVNRRNRERNKKLATMAKNCNKKFLNSLVELKNNPENKKKAARCFNSYISRIAKNEQAGLIKSKTAARIHKKAAEKYKNACLKPCK